MARVKARFAPEHALDWFLVLTPAAIVARWLEAPPSVVFLVTALAIVPLAGLLGRATERLAERAGAGVGGLLNATFGNAAELIIAIVALSRGLDAVVKASIIGSILGNSLLVLGLSILAGGLRHAEQRFNRSAASMGSTLLGLAAIAMIVPTLFWYSAQGSPRESADVAGTEKGLSAEIAVILGAVYLLSLLFSLRTHRHLYAGDAVGPSSGAAGEEPGRAGAPRGGDTRRPMIVAVVVLVAASALIALLSEILVGALHPAAQALGLTDLFVGVIVVAIVGNAAEHATAVFAAAKNQIDLALHIAVGSSLQIALLVAPVLVGLSYLVGPHPIDLHFTLFEVGAVALSVFAVNLVAQDGRSNWMEGVMLLAVYAILAIGFFFLPS